MGEAWRCVSRFGRRRGARGIAREAASAALRHAHDRAGIGCIIAVSRADNFGSRMVLGSIGMVECDAFLRDGHVMLVYESVIPSSGAEEVSTSF